MEIHSNESHLPKKNACSQAGGHHLLSSDEENLPKNRTVLNLLTIIRNIMSSAAETELGALFLNTKTALPMRKTLEELGHPQPRTPIQMDNKKSRRPHQ